MTLNLQTLPPGRRLRALRTAYGLRLYDVAVRTGIPEPRLSEIERGRRDVPQETLDTIFSAVEAAEKR